MEATFLAALLAEPSDETTWLALADWLEEDGQGERAELVRLVRRLRTLPVMKRTKERARLEDRLAELLEAGVRPVVPEVVNSIGMRLALIPPGRFRMGSPADEVEHGANEGPLHEVEISRAFYLGVHEVTQAQYQRVMGGNPSYFSPRGRGKGRVKGQDTASFPVEQVSWEEATEFCRRLSKLAQEKSARRRYRLPSEAEWEYCCRGGASSSTAFHTGESLSSHQANFDGRYEKGPFLGRTCAVGSYRANAFGLYDMHGNIWEWCEDWYADGYYRSSPRRDPPGPPRDSHRALRGGCWDGLASACRSAYRVGSEPGEGSYYDGFRVAVGP
jgi:uncharacterized protein (TIGR02996 family)